LESISDEFVSSLNGVLSLVYNSIVRDNSH